MNFKIFLGLFGLLFFLIGLFGTIFFGPTPALSIFKSNFWMNYFEIYSFSILGLFGLCGYYLLSDKDLIKWLSLLIIILAFLVPSVRFFQNGLF